MKHTGDRRHNCQPYDKRLERQSVFKCEYNQCAEDTNPNKRQYPQHTKPKGHGDPTLPGKNVTHQYHHHLRPTEAFCLNDALGGPHSPYILIIAIYLRYLFESFDFRLGYRGELLQLGLLCHQVTVDPILLDQFEM